MYLRGRPRSKPKEIVVMMMAEEAELQFVAGVGMWRPKVSKIVVVRSRRSNFEGSCNNATMVSASVEDEEALLGVHEPLTRVALVLNLVEGPEMPLAVAFAAPEGIIVTSISRLDIASAVRTALGCNASILHMDIFSWVGVRACGPHWSWRRSSDSSMAVGDMIRGRRRSRARRIDVSGVAVRRYRVVVRPLIRRIEVSKWVHGAIESVVVVASKPTIGGMAWVVTRAVAAGA